MISTHQRMKAYCSEPLENIENYDKAIADKEHMWHCHHRLEVQGQFRNSKELLERCGMYWDRPANELIFLRMDEHRRLHAVGNKYGTVKKLSDETKRKIAEKRMGKGKKVEMTRLADAHRMVFSSMGAAARWLRENGYPKAAPTHIHSALKKNRQSCGAKWRYL